MKEQRMTTRIEKRIVREVKDDFARAQDSVGVPAGERERVSSVAIQGILKAIEQNDEALRFLATI